MSLHSAPCNLDALPIFRLCRLFVAPMVCTAPIFRYSPHCRICYHRLRTYSKVCRSSICAPPSLALFVRRASGTVPRMQSPFSGGFRMIAASCSPLSISAHCAASGVHFISCQRALPLVSFRPLSGLASLATHMEINANKSRPRSRNPRFYWAFRTFAPDFHAWELAFLGEARRIRHLTRGSDARNASANARTPAHAHTRTNARTNARAHAPKRGRTHASADARAHTRHAPERTRAHARTRRGPRARIRARQGTGGTSARAPSAMHTRSL